MNTDLYELTMAQGLWENDKTEEQGCFTAFFREAPFGNSYAVMCGTAELGEFVENFRFTEEDIAYLSELKAPGGGLLFKSGFLRFLADFRPRVDIDAIPEGELVFAREPMVRVTGPMLDCQLLETALLNIIGFQTLVATKTARWCRRRRAVRLRSSACAGPRVPMAASRSRARATLRDALRPRTSLRGVATAFPCRERTRTVGS